MTARDHAAPIPALIHIPLLGRRSVRYRMGLGSILSDGECTQYFGGEGYAGYIIVAQKDFGQGSYYRFSSLLWLYWLYSDIFNNVFETFLNMYR
jgi:hypothetical protein